MGSKIIFSKLLHHLVVTIYVNTTLLQKLLKALQVSLTLFFLSASAFILTRTTDSVNTYM